MHASVCKTQVFLHFLQDTDVASAQPSSIHKNTGPYAVSNVTADKDQQVHKYLHVI